MHGNMTAMSVNCVTPFYFTLSLTFIAVLCILPQSRRFSFQHRRCESVVAFASFSRIRHVLITNVSKVKSTAMSFSLLYI